jgi:uncharacterized protein YuzE
MEPVKTDYDYDARAAYIHVCPGRYHHGQEINDSCRVDFDESGNVIGVELLNQEPYPFEFPTTTTN